MYSLYFLDPCCDIVFDVFSALAIDVGYFSLKHTTVSVKEQPLICKLCCMLSA